MVGWPSGLVASHVATGGATVLIATTAMNPGRKYAMRSPKFRAEISPTPRFLCRFHPRNPNYAPQWHLPTGAEITLIVCR